MEKVSLFVDVQNIYYTTRQSYGCHFDYRQFWTKATAGRQLVKAIAYAIDRPDQKQRQFQAILQSIGFEIKLKPYIQRQDGSSKGDWDVGITIDIIDYADQSDIIVLASGDGDFDLLMDKINPAVRTEVYGVPELTARSLITAAQHFIPIEGSLLLSPH